MISVIILDNGEPNVIRLTYENLYKEIKDIEGAELLVSKDWLKPLATIKNQYVCFVEADCLVSSGYFSSQMGLIKKNGYLRKLAVFGTAIGVNNFGNRFFGYEIADKWSMAIGGVSTNNKQVEPIRAKKSTGAYPVQIAYVPGAILRMSMLLPQLEQLGYKDKPQKDLVKFSAALSLGFWQHGGRININPNATYVTTENYVNDLSNTPTPNKTVIDTFRRELI